VAGLSKRVGIKSGWLCEIGLMVEEERKQKSSPVQPPGSKLLRTLMASGKYFHLPPLTVDDNFSVDGLFNVTLNRVFVHFANDVPMIV
jgi:hypothetical protein